MEISQRNIRIDSALRAAVKIGALSSEEYDEACKLITDGESATTDTPKPRPDIDPTRLRTIAQSGSVPGMANALILAANELASMTRMFHAACADLGAINEALGLDPDDGGAEPIVDAINELKRERDQWVDTQYAYLGECVSCIDGKCVTGPRCVTLGRDGTEVAAGEPVAWMWNSTRACASVEELKRDKIDPMQHNMTPLYAAPQAQAVEQPLSYPATLDELRQRGLDDHLRREENKEGRKGSPDLAHRHRFTHGARFCADCGWDSDLASDPSYTDRGAQARAIIDAHAGRSMQSTPAGDSASEQS